MIGGVAKVVLEVQDQDRAKDFWTSLIGFELVQDEPYGDERWLEVRSRDKGVNLVLEIASDRPIGAGFRITWRTSNVMFYCDDLDATYKELSVAGVGFPQPPVRQSFGWWSMFEDREGNRFALAPRED